MTEININNLNYATLKLANPDFESLSYEAIEERLKKSAYPEIEQGKRKFHPDFQPFNEKEYLDSFPEIKKLIDEGKLNSAFEHFCESGYREIVAGHRQWRTSVEKEQERILSREIIKAYVDCKIKNKIVGWAADINRLDKKLELEVYLDQVKIAEVLSDMHRKDLAKYFGHDGKHGFAINLDETLQIPGPGFVTLKNKENGKIVYTNKCSLKYDLGYLFGPSAGKILAKHSISTIQEALNVYHNAMLSLNNRKLDKARESIEQLLQKNDLFPEILYADLLSIYLNADSVADAIRLYDAAMTAGISDIPEEKIHSRVLSYCSDLWLLQPAEQRSIDKIHKIEMLATVLKNLQKNKSYLFRKANAREINNLLSVMVDSDKAFDTESVEMLCDLVCAGQTVSGERFLLAEEIHAFFVKSGGDVFDLSDYLPYEMDEEKSHSTIDLDMVVGRVLPGESRGEYSSEEMEEIDTSGLFFADWYRRKYDLSETVDPLEHYLANGEESDPNPLFDTKWYLQTYSEKVEGNALLHYIRGGWKEGCSPSYRFDVAKYAERYNVTTEPLSHYLQEGRKKGYETFFYDYDHAGLRKIIASGLFLHDWYKRVNALPAGMDPLIHFFDTGWKEGFDPNPLFDLEWYREQYMASEEGNPLFHYLDIGFKRGYSPSCDFDAVAYSSAHRLDSEPLAHYFASGYRLYFDRVPLADCTIKQMESA